MSEYINNTARRKESIKAILKQLHAGKTVEEVKEEFAAALAETDAAEITEVEQMLIDEGMPAEEIMRLCDVHVLLFQDSLDRKPRPEGAPGHPIYTFNVENSLVQRALTNLGKSLGELKTAPTTETLEKVRRQVKKLMEFERHYLRKENLVFPYLERYKFPGPSVVMWGIHNEIRTAWKKLAKLVELDLDSIPGQIGTVDELYAFLDEAIRGMVYKEESILFPAALERLKPADWDAIRQQEAEIGYCYVQVQPGTGAVTQTADTQTLPEMDLPVPVPAKTAGTVETPPIPPLESSAVAAVSLNTGALTPDQINLMVQNLPIEITFVDENDEVRFYSMTKERLFPRSAAIIGRKVQKCHPPQSMDRVQRILDDFRSGKRDEAEFWIQMRGMFIHILYYAMRDADGSYRGALEVTQNLNRARSLEGERRLADD